MQSASVLCIPILPWEVLAEADPRPAKHSSLEEIQGDCAEQEGWLEGIPAFPGHCEQGSTEGPPHWSWRLRSECSKAFWANPAVRSVRAHMKQSFLGKPCRGKSGTSLSGAICFFLPSRHGSLWILEIIHIYMCIYLYSIFYCLQV